jgi:hypothetical protein
MHLAWLSRDGSGRSDGAPEAGAMDFGRDRESVPGAKSPSIARPGTVISEPGADIRG